MEPRKLSAELVDTIYAVFPPEERLAIGDEFNAGDRIFKVVSLELVGGMYAGAGSITAKLKPADK